MWRVHHIQDKRRTLLRFIETCGSFLLEHEQRIFRCSLTQNSSTLVTEVSFLQENQKLFVLLCNTCRGRWNSLGKRPENYFLCLSRIVLGCALRFRDKRFHGGVVYLAFASQTAPPLYISVQGDYLQEFIPQRLCPEHHSRMLNRTDLLCWSKMLCWEPLVSCRASVSSLQSSPTES